MQEKPLHVDLSASATSVPDLRAAWTEEHNRLVNGVNRSVKWMWVLPVLCWAAFGLRGEHPVPWLPIDGLTLALILFCLWLVWLFFTGLQFIEAQQASYTLHRLDIDAALRRIEGDQKGL